MADTIKVVCAAAAWVENTAYSVGDRRVNDTSKVYECITSGTSAASGGPTGTAADITDGTVHWKYVVTRDYSSLSNWEAGQQKVIVSGDREIAECYGGAADTVNVSINGWTTSSDATILIRASGQERHDGKWNGSKYYRSIADNYGISIYEEYVTLEGLQIEVTSATAVSRHCVYLSTIIEGNLLTIDGCILRGHTNQSFAYRIVFGSDTEAVGLIRNSVLHHQGSASTTNNYCVSWTGPMLTLQNCTIYGGMRGVSMGATTCSATNCLVASQGYNCFYSSGAIYYINYCASSDGTVDDFGGTGNRANQTFGFVDAANTDFHLLSTDTGAKDYGTDLSGTFTDDIDGQTRLGSWDIGADEYVASGNSYSASFSDAASLGESRSIAAGFACAGSDSVSLGEALASVALFARTFADSASLGESVTRTVSFARTFVDAASLGETRSAASGFVRSLSDQATLGESVSSLIVFVRSFADGIALGEARGITSAFGRSASDGLSLGESRGTTSAFSRSFADPTTLGESSTRAAGFAQALAEPVTLSESIAQIAGFVRSVTDPMGLGELREGFIPTAYSRSFSDALAPSESITAGLVNLPIGSYLTVIESFETTSVIEGFGTTTVLVE